MISPDGSQIQDVVEIGLERMLKKFGEFDQVGFEGTYIDYDRCRKDIIVLDHRTVDLGMDQDDQAWSQPIFFQRDEPDRNPSDFGTTGAQRQVGRKPQGDPTNSTTRSADTKETWGSVIIPFSTIFSGLSQLQLGYNWVITC